MRFVVIALLHQPAGEVTAACCGGSGAAFRYRRARRIRAELARLALTPEQNSIKLGDAVVGLGQALGEAIEHVAVGVFGRRLATASRTAAWRSAPMSAVCRYSSSWSRTASAVTGCQVGSATKSLPA